MFTPSQIYVLAAIVASSLSVIAAPMPGNTVTVGDNFGGSSPSSSGSSGYGSTTRVGDTFGPSRFNFAANGGGDDDNDDDSGSDNNNNSGTIQNGDTTNFGINNSSDVSGLFNVGSGNDFNFNDSSFRGNGKRQALTGDDNNNAVGGAITNGNSTDFSLSGSNDLSGLFNAGSGDSLSATDGSDITGNVESAATKRQTTDGDNNANSGDILNGNTSTFGITNSSDVGGLFNAGSGNTTDLANSTIIGNENA